MKQELIFQDDNLTIYCDKIRHPSKIIGVGDTIEAALHSVEKQVGRIMQYGNYQHVTYGKRTIVLKNGALFYCIPDVTLYRGTVILG